MKRIIQFSSLLLLLVLFCSKENPLKPQGGVQITIQNDAIKISNKTTQILHFFLVERGIAAVLDMILSCEPEDPNQIPSGKSDTILYEDIFGYYEHCEVIVYYWNCVRDDSTWITDGVNSEIVQTE
ncbi:hypothetical protein HQ585_19680 [candidate division KSB1 bacterium]|nr:hypothetical protein [candidate division KSB1 bacterium]